MNTSGIKPKEYNVLVKPDDVEKKTKGGIILADSTVEKEEFGRMEGVMVAASPLAFSYAEWPDAGEIPKVGERVLFSRYQATEVQGRDGGKYWLMKDRAIAGVIET
jgi:chaperonin GroES